MRTNRGFNRSVTGLVAVLACGMLVPAHAVDFGDMMNPGRWLGGAQDRGHERFDPGFGVPGYYGQHGQPSHYGSDRHAPPPFGQPHHGYAPYGQQQFGQPQFGQPGMRQEGFDPGWSPDYGSRFSGPDSSAWGYGGVTPSYGVPGTRYEAPRESDHRLEQRVRDLERRVDELERRQHDSRRQSQPDFPQPEYPPLR